MPRLSAVGIPFLQEGEDVNMDGPIEKKALFAQTRVQEDVNMDGPIEKKALFAQTRVQQALEAGAHYIDADDVREALDGFKGALDCQFGVHNDLLARIADMEVKLAASNGGVIQLEQQPVAGLAPGEGIDSLGAYEAWCRVKGLAESGATPQIDARDVLGALVFCESENKALLEKKTSAGRAYQNHIAWLEDQLAKARAALDASQGQVKQLEAEVAELRDLADILSRTSVAIRGPEPDLTRWSHHDLPELAAAMRKQRDICASAANKIQWATPDYSGQEGVCPECGQYEHDGHGEGCMVGRACGIYDVLRLTGALK